jgi:hypothetical protein
MNAVVQADHGLVSAHAEFWTRLPSTFDEGAESCSTTGHRELDRTVMHLRLLRG